MTIRRLIVCFDGTWNTPEDNTNVLRLYQAVSDAQSGTPEQLKFYDSGVGTDRGSRFEGGLFGYGLDQNILQGYVWLCQNFEPSGSGPGDALNSSYATGPEIYVFGFSRGAFTARSLTGLITRCGLVKRDKLAGLKSEKEGRQSEIVRDAWRRYRDQGQAASEAASEFRRQNSHAVKVKFVGVWDTVGALGVPTLTTAALAIRTKSLRFHDLRLSPIVEHAYHALAIDEHRADFNAALWDGCTPEQKSTVEQRWFPGAHANVGGGYEDDRLCDLSLNWIVQKAGATGLQFNSSLWIDVSKQAGEAAKSTAAVPPYLEIEGDEYEDVVRDSYAEFACGLYRLFRIVTRRGRFFRTMLTRGVNETVDPSARAKWATDATYRPRNLALTGRGLSLGDLGS
jgi:uncharacterized protein (DUF2235 family)